MATAYDVVVAGLGGFGSATAYHLSTRGVRVLGLDPYPAGHDLGASHGESRIVRQAYFEGSAYVPLLRRTYELWDRLARDAGERLVRHTGGLFLGPAGSRVFEGSLASARRWEVPHEVLDPAEVTRRFPAFRPPAGTAALFETSAGLVGPERAVLAHLRLAAAAGAELRHGEGVTSWSADVDGVVVHTSGGSYSAGSLVLAPGRWASELLAGLGLPLRVERRGMHWFRPRAGADAFDASRFPVWIWDRDDGTAPYGFPCLDGVAVKAAVHYSRVRPADTWTPAELSDLLAELLPGLGNEHLRSVECTYTMTPDEHFVVGRHPAHEQVVVACGFSGHGFKFTPVLGEVLADLATGLAPSYDLSMFDPRRFVGAQR
ncbi:MAG: sarcosine oxidase [Actinomycetota bacterium]|nr:sarcosine oxidase [Actinomycetota bacterium]